MTRRDPHETIRRLTAALEQSVQRVEELERALRVPVAIIGLGCRYPGGVRDAGSFWTLLEQGRDGVTEVPPERWDVDALYDPDPEVPGKMTTRCGGFLDEVDLFDAEFFGISPREAADVDPRHRLLMETVWEALEGAGTPPSALAGSATGVFVGLMSDAYPSLYGSDLQRFDGYVGTGTSSAVASGRISYLLGLKGPSLTLDTACSSSLVTLHLACQSLRSGECDLALAGGAMLILSPALQVEFSRLGGLAADGRCKSFAAAADGVGWSEGCGVVLVKRLADALRDGDPVLAVVRGTAVNQDGRSSALTAPNGPSQQAVIRRALAQAGVAPGQVSYVECHGTGTTLGDPIELQALGTVMGEGRDAGRPVWIGSVKSNFGHTQAAAGVAGVIKTVLAMRHGVLPPNLHFDEPSPHIPWAELPLRVVTEATPWEGVAGARGRPPRIAGVSSFGISGTNAHVVLEEAPAAEDVSVPDPSFYMLPLSAKTPEALEAMAGRYAEHLELRRDQRLADVCHTAALGRERFAHRLAVVGADREELRAALLAPGRGTNAARPKLAFLFTGQGSQYAGMGRELYESEPVFREALERCAGLFDAELDRPLVSVLLPAAPEAEPAIDRTGYTQPALFALEYALAELWRSWGVEPDVVLGHSIGELVAAQVAGVFTLEEAARLVAARGRLMEELAEGGAMVSARTSEQRASEVIAGHEGQVSIAAVNGPESVVLSGAAEAVRRLAGSLEAAGVETKGLAVSHAFHSPLMEPMLDAFGEVAASLGFRAPSTTLISNRTGVVAGAELGSASYWRGHVRETVRFGEGLETLAGLGVSVCVELGPHPVLSGLGAAALADREIAWLPSLRRGHDGRRTMRESLAGLYGHGVDLDGPTSADARKVALPTYPFQRQRFWVEPAPETGRGRPAGADTGHPLLGERMPLAGGGAIFENELGTARLPYLADHRVFGRVVVPGAAMLETALAAAESYFGPGFHAVEDVVFQSALVLDEAGSRRIQLVLRDSPDGETSFELHSQEAGTDPGAPWRLHASGRLLRHGAPGEVEGEDPSELLSRCNARDPQETYAELAELGLGYGAAFRVLTRLGETPEEVVAHLALPAAADPGSARRYGVHPALLDGALQALAALQGSEKVSLPFEVGSYAVYRSGAAAGYARSRVEQDGSMAVRLFDEAGKVVAEVRGLRVLEVEAARLEAPSALRRDWLYRLEWQELSEPWPRATPEGTWIVVGSGARATALAGVLAEAGATAHRCDGGGTLAQVLARVSGTVMGIVSFWDAPSAEEAQDLAETARRTAIHGLEQLRTLMEEVDTSVPPRLWWVTSGAWSMMPAESSDPSAAVLWGLGRSWREEQPDRPLALVDLEPGTEDSPEALLRLLGAGEEEGELAVRGDRCFVARLARVAEARADETRVDEALKVPSGSESYVLDVEAKGRLDRLRLVAAARRAPAAGEVEVEVLSAGLNFRDVLNALGMYPGEAPAMGGEFAGRVSRIGDGVAHLRVGDPVLGLSPASFSPFVTTDARLVVKKPEGLSEDQAAAVPIVFLTAWYALRDLAALRPGERVLIHAAAGGVGMAAVQLARRWGAQVCATASRAKWETVRASGVRDVADSRSTRFADELGPVDVVLNSLAGEFVDASLSLLGDGGRFIEIGKTDVRSAEEVAASHPGVSYQAFDLAEAGPERLQEMLREVTDALASGALCALPVRRFPLTAAKSALRFMAQAKHIGKVILVPDAAQNKAVTRPGTVLVSGGLGALGWLVARWLVSERGVSHLVLLGRNVGARRPEEVEELRALGAEVTVARCDVAERDELAGVLAALPADQPLRGVVHAAMVLDDALVGKQDAERFSKVMAPKVAGSWNLHRLSLDHDLDFFVLFSSSASLLGSAGQSNYAAANAFLDALAAHRRSLGLPGLSLNWGPWSKLGAAAALSTTLRDRVARQGFDFIEPEQGLALLGEALDRSEAQLGILPLDLRRLSRSMAGRAPAPVLRQLVGGPRPAASRNGAAELEARLRELAPVERQPRITELVSAEVARVLSLRSVSSVVPDVPLRDLGLDSLMAVELRNVLAELVGRRLPATLVFDRPTVRALSDDLLQRLLPDQTSQSAAAEPPRAKGKLETQDLEAMSNEDLNSLLDDKLNEYEGAVR